MKELKNKTLEICNYLSQNYLNEVNKNSSVLVAFDWVENGLVEINTNIDLGFSELEDFRFDKFVKYLKDNNFTFVLGLRNISYDDNPSPVWIGKLKEALKSSRIGYEEYSVNKWPAPIPKFDVSDDVFILRYTFDPQNKLDELAASPFLFEECMLNSKWSEYYTKSTSDDKIRFIVLCGRSENLILKSLIKKVSLNIDRKLFNTMSLSKLIIKVANEREGISTWDSEDENITINAYKKNNKYYGEIVQYDQDGKIKSKEYHIDGIFDRYEYYYENGNLSQSGYIKNSVKDGEIKYYQFNGNLRLIENFKRGLKHGNYTIWYKNGNKKQHSIYRNNKLNGKWIEWYMNGVKRSEGNMLYGMMEGSWTFWYHNGKKELEFNLDFGIPIDSTKIYHDNGVLKQEITF